MKEIPLTRGLVSTVDDEDYEALSRFKWFAHKTGYAVRKFPHPEKPGSHVLLWMRRVILGLPFGDQRKVDHIDLNRLNNARVNLRECTKAENGWNRGSNKNNTSGFKGVTWKAGHKKWVARIQTDGKSRHLGYFNSPEEAHEAYRKAASDMHGEFANFG